MLPVYLLSLFMFTHFIVLISCFFNELMQNTVHFDLAPDALLSHQQQVYSLQSPL